MSDSEIMLATAYDPKKVTYPVEVSIKLDGVAADIYKTPNGWVAQSRQGKPIPSIGHIVKFLNTHVDLPVNTHLIGELTVLGVDAFKDAGGIIRRDAVDERIVLNLYDMYEVGKESMYYDGRVGAMEQLMKRIHNSATRDLDGVSYKLIRRVPVVGVVANAKELQTHLDGVLDMMKSSDLFEGFVLRSLKGADTSYKVGKRSRGMMKYKPRPTVDLQIVGFEEATANKTIKFLGDTFHKDEGLKAVGRIIALYKGEEIGVGPGCLTHEQRRDLWKRYEQMQERGEKLLDKHLIAEVEYMLDNNYTALRQPVFMRWRTDKTSSSEEVQSG